MLTNVQIRRFKTLEDVSVELGHAVVLIGPNDSGKTSALQALALWEAGLKKWSEKRKGKKSPKERVGVTINRKDLFPIPVGGAKLLWKNLNVRSVEKKGNTQETRNIRIDIIVEGITNGEAWQCGLEFDYANEESIYCRPLRSSEDKSPERMKIPEQAKAVKVAYLPPMSGLRSEEPKYEEGRINVLLGEGDTGQVLRNICYNIYVDSKETNAWSKLTESIDRFFGVEILPPRHIVERGEISMSYKNRDGIELDLSTSGRGLQQTLLLLAYLYSNPHSVLLLDEPDAHLEVLRQRQIYQELSETANRFGSQIVAASHSEVVLNEAADRDIVIAFVGHPHRIDDRGSQLLKALKEIGFEHYYLAEQKGWVLYVEGATDLAILQTLAEKLGHKAQKVLDRPFVHYVGNLPRAAEKHFYGLREAKPDLAGFALFDRLDRALPDAFKIEAHIWRRREIENYFCSRDVLRRFAETPLEEDEFRENELFWFKEKEKRLEIMERNINELENALKTLGKPDPWSADIKATDDFLDPLFDRYFKELNLSNLMRKTDYHRLAKFVEREDIDPEVVSILDKIASAADSAKPRSI